MRCAVRGPAPAVHAFARYVREKLVELALPGSPAALYGVITGVRERAAGGAAGGFAVAVVDVLPNATARVCDDAVRATVAVLSALWGLDAEQLEVEVGRLRTRRR